MKQYVFRHWWTNGLLVAPVLCFEVVSVNFCCFRKLALVAFNSSPVRGAHRVRSNMLQRFPARQTRLLSKRKRSERQHKNCKYTGATLPAHRNSHSIIRSNKKAAAWAALLILQIPAYFPLGRRCTGS